MNKFSKELIESLTDACEHAEDKPSAVRVHVVKVREPDPSNAPNNRRPNRPNRGSGRP